MSAPSQKTGSPDVQAHSYNLEIEAEIGSTGNSITPCFSYLAVKSALGSLGSHLVSASQCGQRHIRSVLITAGEEPASNTLLLCQHSLPIY